MAIASGMDTQSARRIFSAMYPEAACLPMVASFVQIVIHESRLQSRPPVRPLALAAVA